MKLLSLAISLLGILFLFVLLFEEPVRIESYSEILEMKNNKKVLVTGIAENERDYDGFRIFDIREIEIICTCKFNRFYSGKEVEVIGRISEYEGKKQIRTSRIKLIIN